MLNLAALTQPLHTVQAPDPLERAAKIISLRNAQIQGQDLQAQVQERQAAANKVADTEQKQQRVAQILNSATIDPETGSPDPRSPAMQQLFREFPEVHAALTEHYAKVGSEAAVAANQRGDLKVKQETLRETISRNQAEEKQKQAEAQRKLEEGVDVNPGATRIFPGTTKPPYTAPAKPEKLSFEEQTANDWLARNPGKTLDDYQTRDANRKKPVVNVNAGTLTDAGLDAAALSYAKTGILPAMGMGGAATRIQIINRAADLMPKLDIASNKADFSANSKSLDQATKLKDALQSFENTALKNMAILEGSAKKVLDSGSPLLNKPLRSIDEKALGGTDLPVYRAARQIVVNEVAKLTNNPGLTGQLSDTARAEIESLMPADMTMAQLLNLLPTLRQDMRNRTSSLDDQIQGIRKRISGSGSVQDRGLIVPGGALEKLLQGGK